MTAQQKLNAYLAALKRGYIKCCRLRFLNENGGTAFSIDNNPINRRSRSFIEDGNISVNLQNGTRRTATIILANANGEYDYNVNNLWFGTQIALDEGLILPNGEPYYIQQGVFVIVNPESALSPSGNTITLNLTDKWANLDGSLLGNLEGTYKVNAGTNIFSAITSILSLGRGNGLPVDSISPIYTNYYDNLTQTLQDGTVVAMTDSPYTLEVESGAYSDVVLGLSGMLNAWVGYDASGAMRIDPSQDDILDTTKPIQYHFSMNETVFLGATYRAENTKVYNDYIVVGQALEGEATPAARATNLDPQSDTNVNIIGKKTYREQKDGYVTKTQCQDLAVWKLKRSAILQNSVDISCSQILHIKENELVTIERSDKSGNPTEKHLVMGFNRPLASTSPMTISCVSVTDFPIATVTPWPE